METKTDTFKALIIDEPVWELMTALDPHFEELNFGENEGRYLVLNFESEHTKKPVRWMIITPQTFLTTFDHIENAKPIKTYNFVR